MVPQTERARSRRPFFLSKRSPCFSLHRITTATTAATKFRKKAFSMVGRSPDSRTKRPIREKQNAERIRKKIPLYCLFSFILIRITLFCSETEPLYFIIKKAGANPVHPCFRKIYIFFMNKCQAPGACRFPVNQFFISFCEPARLQVLLQKHPQEYTPFSVLLFR